MAVLAHPDDESFGMAATFAKCAAEGVETYLVTATRGERGWRGNAEDDPGLESMGKLREGELRAAARVLGIRQIELLGYIDGELDQVQPRQAMTKIARLIRQLRPQVVVTFAPDGDYVHPDHIAISHFTAAAIVATADPHHLDQGLAPHVVSKFYYLVTSEKLAKTFARLFDGAISMDVDGVLSKEVAWPDWAINARVRGDAFLPILQKAIRSHRSQQPGLPGLDEFSAEQWLQLTVENTYIRVFSTVNGGRNVEDNLFAGLG